MRWKNWSHPGQLVGLTSFNVYKEGCDLFFDNTSTLLNKFKINLNNLYEPTFQNPKIQFKSDDLLTCLKIKLKVNVVKFDVLHILGQSCFVVKRRGT